MQKQLGIQLCPKCRLPLILYETAESKKDGQGVFFCGNCLIRFSPEDNYGKENLQKSIIQSYLVYE